MQKIIYDDFFEIVSKCAEPYKIINWIIYKTAGMKIMISHNVFP